MREKVWAILIFIIFAPSKNRMGYGVMVTQQILVLFFQVRVLVSQLLKRGFLMDEGSLFFF